MSRGKTAGCQAALWPTHKFAWVCCSELLDCNPYAAQIDTFYQAVHPAATEDEVLDPTRDIRTALARLDSLMASRTAAMKEAQVTVSSLNIVCGLSLPNLDRAKQGFAKHAVMCLQVSPL